MVGSPSFTARLRGGYVGAVSGTASLAAHCMGGGSLPSSETLMVLVGGCVVVGVWSAGRAGRNLTDLIVQLCLGQFAGHILLAASAEHMHGSTMGVTPSPLMAGAHLAMAVAVALGLVVAESLVELIARTALRWTICLGSPPPTAEAPWRPTLWQLPVRSLRSRLAGGGGVSRAPPVAASPAC